MILKCVTTYDVDKGHIDEINDRMKIGIPYVVEASSLENYPLERMDKVYGCFLQQRRYSW